MKSTDIRLILVDPSAELCRAWSLEFEGYDSVKVLNGYFEELSEYDCIVSARNSFGLMDGGVDLAIIRYFGIELMDRVQEQIVPCECRSGGDCP